MGQLISICFIIIKDNGSTVTYENVIYLRKPEILADDESLLRFENVFDAKNYLRRNAFTDFPIQIAS